MINHRKRNEVDVDAAKKTTLRDAFAIDQNQSFFREQTAQVELHSAVTTIAHLLVGGPARLLRQKSLQVLWVADP